MIPADKYCIAYITAPDKAIAERIAEELLKKRLIACANVYEGITSMYWWEGKIEKDKEVVLFCKTRKDRLEEIENQVRELHPYTVPCIISFELFEGNEDYLSWLSGELKEEMD